MNNKFADLLAPRPPYIHLWPATPPRPLPSYNWPLEDVPAVVRRLNGIRTQRLDQFYQEVSAAWQFPDHFGNNNNALIDCLSDLSWIPSDHYITLITGADKFMTLERDESAVSIVHCFALAADVLAGATSETLGRSPASLHTVLLVEPSLSEGLIARLQSVPFSIMT